MLALALIAGLAVASLPLAASAADASRVRQAAGFLASRMRLARQQAIARSAAVALVFDETPDRSLFLMCTDGNGNGVTRADITGGADRCETPPVDVTALHPGIRFAVDPALRGPDGEPGSEDAIRFGRSAMASFSPAGTSSSGSVYLRSASGLQYVVRVAGVTARARVLRYDTGTRRWVEP